MKIKKSIILMIVVITLSLIAIPTAMAFSGTMPNGAGTYSTSLSLSNAKTSVGVNSGFSGTGYVSGRWLMRNSGYTDSGYVSSSASSGGLGSQGYTATANRPSYPQGKPSCTTPVSGTSTHSGTFTNVTSGASYAFGNLTDSIN